MTQALHRSTSERDIKCACSAYQGPRAPRFALIPDTNTNRLQGLIVPARCASAMIDISIEATPQVLPEVCNIIVAYMVRLWMKSALSDMKPGKIPTGQSARRKVRAGVDLVSQHG